MATKTEKKKRQTLESMSIDEKEHWTGALRLISLMETLGDQLLTMCEQDQGFGSARAEAILKELKAIGGSITCALKSRGHR